MTGARVLANLPVPATDGAVLATDVYLPVGASRVPVVVTRTAYDRSAHLAVSKPRTDLRAAPCVHDGRSRSAP